jgi:dTDP-4-amino-4,6-dideoxygalactose transaminase
VKIPFVDLSRRYRAIRQEVHECIDIVGSSGAFVLGDAVTEFENRIATYERAKFAIAVANGSDALFLSLKALGIGRNDEVITASNSFIASAWVIVAAGAVPVFSDIGTDLNIDPESIRKKITSKTKAIMPVYLTGRPAKLTEISRISREYGIPIIGDAAQAIGARYRDQGISEFAKITCYSLHPLKNLGVFGDGGVALTSDQELAHKLRLLRNHGLSDRNTAEVWGYNSRLDAIQAAIGVVQLRHIEKWNARRRSIAQHYNSILRDHVHTPEEGPGEFCVYHNYVIRSSIRNRLSQHLKEAGIDTRIHYPIPIHKQKCFTDVYQPPTDLKFTEEYAEQILSLPVFPELTDSEISYIGDSVRSFFHK